jgi:hypothetical protein
MKETIKNKTSDKTKIFIALSLLTGLKLDLEHRFNNCEDCKWTLSYINEAIKALEEL